MYTISTPKTQRGVRRVVLDAETLAVLETRRALQEEEKRKAGSAWGAPSPEYADLIFTTLEGGPIHPRNFDRTWYALQDAAQVRRIRFHDLRHMHVSLLHQAGVELRAIADRVGHTDPSFTLKRYAHVLDDRRRAAAIPLSQLLSARGEAN
jgi:integrase